MLPFLLACACPSFEDIVVEVDVAEDRDRVLGDVEDAIADFAEWTAREGVCVGRVEAREGLRAFGWDGLQRDSMRYDEAGGLIQVEATQPTLETSVRQGLCYALDAQEGLSRANPDLFPFDDVPRDAEKYTPARRSAAAFAQACDNPPTDLSVLRAAGEGCGEDFLSARERFLDEVVFPGFPEAAEVGVGAPIGPAERRTLATFGGEHGDVYDMGGDDVGLVYLVGAERSLGLASYRALRLVHQDPTTGAVLGAAELPVIPHEASSAQIVPTDTGGSLVLFEARDLLDPASGQVLLTLPDGLGLNGTSAVVDGVLYVGVFAGDGPAIQAWDIASGAEVELPTEGLGDVAGMVPGDMIPTEGGLEVGIDTTWARLADGAWTTWATPTANDGVVVGDGVRALLALTPGAKVQPVTLDEETGAWTVRPICVERDEYHPMTRLVRAQGRAWFVFVHFTSETETYAVAPLDLGAPE